MAYDCKNQAPVATCGSYVQEYIGNMEYITQGILDIINEIILSPETGPNDITNRFCECLPICQTTGETTGETTRCVNEKLATVFNCETWEQIKDLLIDVSSLTSDEGGYIPLLCQTIKCFLARATKIKYGFAAQMERFLCLAESLNTRLDSVSCNSQCPELVGDLLCLLMQILTKLMTSVSKAATLMYYSNCDINVIDGNRVIGSFFECMVCDFVNDLCELERLIPEISAIVIGFATCDMQECTPCYTAPSIPRKVRPMCPPNLMSSGNNSGYPYQRQGGCSCGCGCSK